MTAGEPSSFSGRTGGGGEAGGMMLPLFLLLAAAPAGEDAAHRADRLEVRRLNSRSSSGYAGRRRAAAPAGEAQADYARAQAEYRARLDAWRQRVAACEAGQYEACQ